MALALDRFISDFWSKHLPLEQLEQKLVEAGATAEEAGKAIRLLRELDVAPNDGQLGGAREIGSLFRGMNERPREFLEPGVSGKPVYDLLSLLAAEDPTTPSSDRLAWVRELRPRERHGLHGMFIVGTGDRFVISHIPMHKEDPHAHHHHGDQTPHNLQALWTVRMTRSTLPPGTSLASGEFTFKPDRLFHLNDLLRGEIPTIRGTVHRGNFEHQGPAIGTATLAVESLINAQVLPEKEAEQASLGYWAFGTPEQTYLVHRVEGRPDFYQLLRVELEQNEHWTAEALAKGDLSLSIPERGNEVDVRLKEGEELTAVIEPRGPVKLKVVEEIAALHGPDFVEPVR